jgi:hypothetical protein
VGLKEGVVGEELETKRQCIASAWHPSGVPTLLLILSEWPSPKALLERLGCWHELMVSIEVGADMLLELSPVARAGFIAQIRSGELSFTLDHRPRWNRSRPHTESGGIDGYSTGPVAQSLDIRAVAAYAKRQAVAWKRKQMQNMATKVDGSQNANPLSQPSEVQPTRSTADSKWSKGVNVISTGRYLRVTQAKGDTEPLPDMQDVSDDSDGLEDDGTQNADPQSQPSEVQSTRSTADRKKDRLPVQWLVGPGVRAEDVDWILDQAEKLPTLTTRGQRGRWVTRGVERLNTAVRNALEEELYSLYHDSVFTAHFATQD